MLNRFKQWWSHRQTRKEVRVAIARMCKNLNRRVKIQEQISIAIKAGNLDKAKYLNEKLGNK
ncbi:MAG: hypothetical protein ACXAC5_04770 [Promethearchaeota archaeon]|jgi:hypothetical protein